MAGLGSSLSIIPHPSGGRYSRYGQAGGHPGQLLQEFCLRELRCPGEFHQATFFLQGPTWALAVPPACAVGCTAGGDCSLNIDVMSLIDRCFQRTQSIDDGIESGRLADEHTGTDHTLEVTMQRG